MSSEHLFQLIFYAQFIVGGLLLSIYFINYKNKKHYFYNNPHIKKVYQVCKKDDLPEFCLLLSHHNLKPMTDCKNLFIYWLLFSLLMVFLLFWVFKDWIILIFGTMVIFYYLYKHYPKHHKIDICYFELTKEHLIFCDGKNSHQLLWNEIIKIDYFHHNKYEPYSLMIKTKNQTITIDYSLLSVPAKLLMTVLIEYQFMVLNDRKSIKIT